MLNGKQLLHTNVPQKCLFTLRMIRGYINVWMNMVVLLLKFSWSQYKDTHNTSRIFFIEFREWLCPHFYHRVTDWWQYEPGRQKQGFLNGAKFSRKLCVLKTFLFQKDNYSFCEFWNFPVCYWRPLGKLSSLRPAIGVWTRILLMQNVTQPLTP